MIVTDYLKLNKIEGTDIPDYAPFNENVIKIENAIKSSDTKVTDLQTASSSYNSRLNIIDEQQREQNTNISTNTSNISSLDGRVKTLEDETGKGSILIGGVEKTGTIHNVKFEVTPDFTSTHKNVKIVGKDENDVRLLINAGTTSTNINITEQLGISTTDDIYVLDCFSYSKELKYGGSQNFKQMNLYRMCGLPTDTNNIYLQLSDSFTEVVEQTYNSSSSSWIPSLTPYNPTGTVIVQFNYIELD